MNIRENEDLTAAIAAVRARNAGRARRVFIHTFGCQQNEADSEKLLGLAMEMGYTPAATQEEADLILINTCAVREHAEQRVFGNIGARLILRASVTLLPIVFLLGALWCQRKKFIIDEDFYEQMLAELETRREAVAVGTAEAE